MIGGILEQEVSIACTQSMLLGLSRDARAAYLLGEVVGFSDVEAGEALGIAPAAFRQRLARARRTVRDLVSGRCGLVDDANPCRCARQAAVGAAAGELDEQRAVFARLPRTGEIDTRTVERAVEQIEATEAIAMVFRRYPGFVAPATVWEAVRSACADLLGEAGRPAGRFRNPM